MSTAEDDYRKSNTERLIEEAIKPLLKRIQELESRVMTLEGKGNVIKGSPYDLHFVGKNFKRKP